AQGRGSRPSQNNPFGCCDCRAIRRHQETERQEVDVRLSQQSHQSSLIDSALRMKYFLERRHNSAPVWVLLNKLTSRNLQCTNFSCSLWSSPGLVFAYLKAII